MKKTSNRHCDHIRATCGCWDGEDDTEPTTTCRCGATYLMSVVVAFPAFKCYDCGLVYSLRR